MEIEEKIYQWAKVRGILDASPDAQLGRLIEEAGELAKAIRTNNTEEMIDAIGDMTVVILNHYSIISGDVLKLGKINESKEKIKEIVGNDVLDLMLSIPNSTISNMFEYLLDEEHSEAITHLTILSAVLLDKPLYYCLEQAYDEIKDRRGMIINGSFVKEADFIKKGIEVDWANLNEEESDIARKLFLETGK